MTTQIALQVRAALDVATIGAPMIASGLWIKSASIKVRDSIGYFIGDLQQQGRWNSRAAIASAVSAALMAVAHYVG